MEHNVGPVNADPSATGAPKGGGEVWRLWLRAAFPVALSFLAGAGAVWGGHRAASSSVVDIGPTDAHYVSGFREIERDGPAYFRWSAVPSSRVVFPLRFCGPGTLQVRARRHFVDPAKLTVSLDGVILGEESIQAGGTEPYRIIEFPVLKAACASNTSVLLEASVENERPLGVAIDWLRLRSESGFVSPPPTLIRGGVCLALIAVTLRIAGVLGWSLLAINGPLTLLIGLIFSEDPTAAERILRGGLVALTLTLAVGLSITRWSGIGSLSVRRRTLLAAITVGALAVRLGFLHPQAFYPDYRVHALVQQTFSSLGLFRFLDQLFEIQYARSLGLQSIDGNWYPFPYPPGPYILIGAVQTASGLDPLDAATALSAAAGALMPVLTMALGLRLGFPHAVGLGAAFFLALQPLFLRRMALGYFPGVIGQFVDGLALIVVAGLALGDGGWARRWWATVGLLLAGFLVYTQSIANFGLLVASLLALELARRSAAAAGAVRVGAAALMALTLSVGIFYWRYAPVFDNVTRGQPQPESRVLDRLEQIRQNSLANELVEKDEDLNDPFAGTTYNPLRGIGRLISRLWRFNGPFVLAIVAGLWFLWRQEERARSNFMVAWFLVCVWISVLAAGMPSPNGFQHLKDLEFVSPLLALALGLLTTRIRDRSTALAWTFGAAWLLFAGRAFVLEFRERLLPLAGL